MKKAALKQFGYVAVQLRSGVSVVGYAREALVGNTPFVAVNQDLFAPDAILSIERRSADKSATEQIAALLLLVSDRFKVGVEDLRGFARTALFTQPRHVVFYLCDFYKIRQCHVATFFKRDHGTIAHGVKSVKDRMDVNQPYKRIVLELREKAVKRLQNTEAA